MPFIPSNGLTEVSAEIRPPPPLYLDSGDGRKAPGRLVFNVGTSDPRLNVFPHGVMRTDGITVACVGIREDRNLHGQDDFPGVVYHVAHTGPGVGPAQLVRRGIAPGHVEGVIAQRFPPSSHQWD